MSRLSSCVSVITDGDAITLLQGENVTPGGHCLRVWSCVLWKWIHLDVVGRLTPEMDGNRESGEIFLLLD
jgi:hypothetical protein